MSTKTCIKCNITKPIIEFYNFKTHYSGRCKLCFAQYQRQNPNNLTSKRKYENLHRVEINNKQKENYHKNLLVNREYGRLKRKRLYDVNKVKYQEYQRRFKRLQHSKHKNNPDYYLPRLLRSRFLMSVNRDSKKSSALKLLGCTMDEFKQYFNKLFKSGMSWNNHGIYGWHIDHIIPCDSFDLTDPKQQVKCFHFSNLQPLWCTENLRKSNKVILS